MSTAQTQQTVQVAPAPLLTIEQFREALPPQLKKRAIGQDVVDGINSLLSDPDMAEQYRDNLLGYTHVIKEGKFKLASYVSAVKYVTQKMMGKNNQDAHMATFPDKWNDWYSRGVDAKTISTYVSAYNASALVNLILEQTLVPNWILNQDVRQKAINKLSELMMTAQSEKVQCEAANSLLTHLKMPEKLKVELELGEKTGSVMDGLRQQTAALASQMQQMIQAGAMNAKEVAEHRLVIEGEVERVS